MVHPSLPLYAANLHGTVINTYTKKVLPGSIDVYGYNVFASLKGGAKLNTRKGRHVLVWECFNGEVPTGMQIDHIDGDKACNALSNLQSLSSAQHHQKTTADNPLSNVQSGRTKSIPVISTCLRTGKRTKYSSAPLAARANKQFCRSKIAAVARGARNSHAGHLFSYEQKEDDAMEEWRPIQNSKHWVSSLGRIKTKTGVVFRGTFHGIYLVCNAGGRTRPVHCWVCEAFHGPQPSVSHTVDHVDRCPVNNAAVNLRWATKTEQSLNSARVKGVRAIDGSGCVVGEWPSITSACLATGCDNSSIGKVCKGLRSLSKGLKWMYM